MNTPARLPRPGRRRLAAAAFPIVSCLTMLAATLAESPAAPRWIWSAPLNQAKPNEVVHFRKTFEVDGAVGKATLFASCDNTMTIWLNGTKIAESSEWQTPVEVDVRKALRAGRNVLAVRAGNDGGGTAGFVARLDFGSKGAKPVVIESNADWKMAASVEGDGWREAAFNDVGWKPAVEMVALGGGPWGDLANASRGSGKGASGTDPASLAVAEGFSVELVYSVPKGEQGSWVSLANAPGGGLVASDQGGAGLFRITVTETDDGPGASVEKIDIPLSGAQGLLWNEEGLYVHVSGKGLFRARDTDGDGRLDTVDELGGPNGGGEHGNHAVIETEDGAALYVDAGNHTNIPDGITGSRLPRTWGEDLLLPRQWDARGHARGRLAPGGWIARVSNDSKEWEIVSIGYRNQYDIAINRHGEMFTYDADMEWDMGMPWYRPTRICHAVSGSDFGWRSGTGKWPTYYEDSLPPTVEIGPGSPTGVVFGTGAKFPARYQDALYALDWTFGTMYAIHLEPRGAGWSGTREEFVSGSPLPLTDAVVGADGALYFTIGGRGTQSALYRVVYTGSESTEPASGEGDPAAAEARSLRRSLERFHGRIDGEAVKTAWPHLASEDRFLRHAARLAIEAQPARTWQDRALAEARPQARITAAVALARVGEESLRGRLLDSLLELDPGALDEEPLLGLLRAYSLAFIRMGAPEADRKARIVTELDPMLPSDSDAVNLELVNLLVYLDAPGIVGKSIALMETDRPQAMPDWGELIQRNQGYGGTIRKMLDNPPPTREIAIAFALRNARFGWSLDERKRYFEFINRAATHTGGASYTGFLENIRKEALDNASEAERAALASITGESLQAPPPFEVTPPKGPGRAWTVAEAVAAVEADGLAGRDFEAGRNLFHATACAACHLFNGEGGAVGPDLSTVRNKFSQRDLLEAVIEPSKVISDQYGSFAVKLKDGKTLTGLVVEHPDEEAMDVYLPDPAAEPVRVRRSDVVSVEQVPISQMPPGLVNVLSPEELLDLTAYLLSRGNPSDPMFAK